MVTADGCVVAMDDATIVWKPKDGKQKRVKIEAQASVLLGLVGPRGMVDRVVVGDDYGGVNLISLSKMELIDRFVVGNSMIRSLCSSSISGESILVGCEDGSVHLVGTNVPNRVVNDQLDRAKVTSCRLKLPFRVMAKVGPIQENKQFERVLANF